MKAMNNLDLLEHLERIIHSKDPFDNLCQWVDNLRANIIAENTPKIDGVKLSSEEEEDYESYINIFCADTRTNRHALGKTSLADELTIDQLLNPIF